MSAHPFSLPVVQQALVDSAERLYQLSDQLPARLDLAAQAIVNSLTSGGKVICSGQGHGAWLAQQMCHHLVQGHQRARPPLAALELCLDSHPALQMAPGAMSARLTALGQGGDIWLAFALGPWGHAELVSAAHVARELDMILLVIGADTESSVWADALQDTDIWLGLPGSAPASLFCSAWWTLHGLCEAVDIHLLGEDS